MNKFPLLLALALAASARAQPLDQPMDRPAARENAPAAPLDLNALGDKPLAFTQDASGLHVRFPAGKRCDYAYALKITGLTPTTAR